MIQNLLIVLVVMTIGLKLDQCLFPPFILDSLVNVRKKNKSYPHGRPSHPLDETRDTKKTAVFFKTTNRLAGHKSLMVSKIGMGSIAVFLCLLSAMLSIKYFLPAKGFIPREAKDFLRPEFVNKLALTFPNDDDANLYWLKLIIDKYGRNYLQSLMNLRPVYFRGNGATKMAIDKGDSLTATACSILLMSNPATSNSTFPLPSTDPFVTFPQTAAILRGTKNLATAKFYLSRRLSYRYQAATPMNFWSVRKDVPPPPGIKPLFDYPKQTDPLASGKWMSDRAMVEQFRGQVQLFVGDVKGGYPTLDLGLYPTGQTFF